MTTRTFPQDTKTRAMRLAPASSGALIFAGALMLLLVLAYWRFGASSLLFAEDQALTLAVGETILKGEIPLVGAPSHIGGRHLGALYYWVVAACLGIAGGEYVTASFLLSFITVCGICAVALLCGAVVAHGRSLVVGGALLLLACGEAPSLVSIPWQNHFFLLPLSLLYWSALRWFAEGHAKLPLVALTASLTLQSHFSSGPLIAAMLVAGILRWGLPLARRDFQGWLSPVGVAVVALWIPSVVYELTYKSNLLALWHGLGKPHPHAGVDAAMELFITTSFARVNLSLTTPHHTACALLVAGVAMWGILSVWKELFPETRRMFLVLSATAVIYVTLLSRQEPPLAPYYLFALFPLPLIILVVGLSGALRTQFVPLRVLGAISLAGVILCSGARAADQIKQLSSPNFARYHSLSHAEAMASVLRNDAGSEPIIVLPQGSVQIMGDGYHLFLGALSKIRYAEQLIELPSFQKPHRPAAGYLVECPYPSKGALERRIEEVSDEWSLVRPISLRGCQRCRDCVALRLERRVAHGNE